MAENNYKKSKFKSWRKLLATSFLAFAGTMISGNIIQGDNPDIEPGFDTQGSSVTSLSYEFNKPPKLGGNFQNPFNNQMGSSEILSQAPSSALYEFVDQTQQDAEEQQSTQENSNDNLDTETEQSQIIEISPELQQFAQLINEGETSPEKIEQLQTTINAIADEQITVDNDLGPQTLGAVIDIIAENNDIAFSLSNNYVDLMARYGLADDLGKKLAKNPSALKHFIEDKTASIDTTGQSYDNSTVIIQYALADYNAGPVDGGYGSLTQNAVDAFLDSYAREQVSEIQIDQTQIIDNNETDNNEYGTNEDDAEESTPNDTDSNDSPTDNEAQDQEEKEHYNEPQNIDDLIPNLDRYYQLAAKEQLNQDDISTIQSIVGAYSDGAFGPKTAQKLRSFLQENPQGYAYLGKGIEKLLQKSGTAPKIAADLAKQFKEDPEFVKKTANEIASQNSGTYIYSLAVALASSQTDISRPRKEINSRDIQRDFQNILFTSKGVIDSYRYKTPDGEYKTDELGLCIANFSTSDTKRIIQCQNALNENGYEAGTADGAAGKQTALALAQALADNPIMVNLISDNKRVAHEIFGLLLSKSKQEPQIAQTLRDSSGFNAVMLKDLATYATHLDNAIRNPTDGKVQIKSPDGRAIGLKLALASQSYDQSSSSNGFTSEFAQAAAQYLNDYAQSNQLAPQSLLFRVAKIYEYASWLEPSYNEELVEKLKKRYPHADEGVVELSVEINDRHNLNPEPTLALMDIESRLDIDIIPILPDGTPASSGKGLIQALSGTWISWWNKFKKYINGADEKEKQYGVLALRTDPAIAIEVLALAIKDSGYTDILEYYIKGHHFSPRKGNLVWNLPASTPASSVFNEKELRANPYLRSMTVGDVLESFRRKFRQRGGFEKPLFKTDNRVAGIIYCKLPDFHNDRDYSAIALYRTPVQQSPSYANNNDEEYNLSTFVTGSPYGFAYNNFLTGIWATINIDQQIQNSRNAGKPFEFAGHPALDINRQ